jgi:hypothetical protein
MSSTSSPSRRIRHPQGAYNGADQVNNNNNGGYGGNNDYYSGSRESIDAEQDIMAANAYAAGSSIIPEYPAQQYPSNNSHNHKKEYSSNHSGQPQQSTRPRSTLQKTKPQPKNEAFTLVNAPPRPSRANTANLHDDGEQTGYSDPYYSQQQAAGGDGMISLDTNYAAGGGGSTGPRLRSGTNTAKSKKGGVFGLMSILSPQ